MANTNGASWSPDREDKRHDQAGPVEYGDLIAALPRVVTATAEMRCIKLARFHTATVRITRVRFTVTLRLTG
jgi:hypothetical protein